MTAHEPELPSAAPFLAGSVIAGKYRIERALGVGGMGAVMAARHEQLGQDVAVKLLLPSAGGDPDTVARFVREAQAAARLRSDHVVRVHDVGVHESGTPYIVMERLEGRDLSQEIERRGALPVAEAVDLVVAALGALEEAHALGIVHRDLKPANLFLASRHSGPPRLKVLDFGISKLTEGQGILDKPALTITSSLLGTPGYMSPEQVRSSRNVDERTDVWAMGVVLYEMLSGGPAFDGETLGDVFAKIREEDLPPLRGLRLEVGEELSAVVARCVRRKRDERVASATEMRALLLPHASESTRALHSVAADSVDSDGRERVSGTVARAPGESGAEVSEHARTAAAWSTRSTVAARPRRFVAAAALVAAVGVVGGYLAWRMSSAPTAAPPATGIAPEATTTTAPPPPPPAVVAAPDSAAAIVAPERPPEPSEHAAPPLPNLAPPRPPIPPSARPGTVSRPAPPPPPPPKDDLGI